MTANPTLAKYFENISIADLINHQIEFVSIALGKKSKFNGKSLLAAHQSLQIQKHEFECSVEIILDSFHKNGVNYDDLADIRSILRSLEDTIVCNKFSDKA